MPATLSPLRAVVCPSFAAGGHPGPRWTDGPAATALLADCARRPPRLIRREDRYALTTDRWSEYSPRDTRVMALVEIHDAAFLAAEHVSPEAAIEVLRFGVADAIRAAIEGRL